MRHDKSMIEYIVPQINPAFAISSQVEKSARRGGTLRGVNRGVCAGFCLQFTACSLLILCNELSFYSVEQKIFL